MRCAIGQKIAICASELQITVIFIAKQLFQELVRIKRINIPLTGIHHHGCRFCRNVVESLLSLTLPTKVVNSRLSFLQNVTAAICSASKDIFRIHYINLITDSSPWMFCLEIQLLLSAPDLSSHGQALKRALLNISQFSIFKRNFHDSLGTNCHIFASKLSTLIYLLHLKRGKGLSLWG